MHFRDEMRNLLCGRAGVCGYRRGGEGAHLHHDV
eukprot:COSAG06_NODE_70540_length_191_cov_53.641304_1_plen_33_part_10